jgi:D-alanine-D-alanine ligase
MSRKLVVAILFGGRSGEHEVSLMSAQGIMSAIDRDKFEVVPIGITKEGRWLASGDPYRALSSGVETESSRAALLAEPTGYGLVRLEDRGSVPGILATKLRHIDVVFPILHGPYGEDGTVQGLLELANMPYVGAGVVSSAVGMDKILFKDIMRAHGLPVVQGMGLKRRDFRLSPEETVRQIETEIGYSCFVKPANLGSSVGVSKARTRAELKAALEEAARYDRKILVETAVDAREIEVSVLGNDDPIASLPGEIVPCNEFYDYSAKYLDGESDLLIPAPISEEVQQRVQELAVEAYKAIDCAGMARVDLFLSRDTGAVFINEVNTLPGFTPISMYPKLWEASGVTYSELIERLIELALERHVDRQESITSYEPAGD